MQPRRAGLFVALAATSLAIIAGLAGMAWITVSQTANSQITVSDPNLADPANPKDDDSDITSTNPIRLTLGSWNTTNTGAQSLSSALSPLLASADIVGLQQVNTSAVGRYGLQSAESSTIGLYFAADTSPENIGQLANPIIYNKFKLAFVTGGYKQLASAEQQNYYVVYARFRIKTSGQEFYVLNTQFASGVQSDGQADPDASTASAYKSQLATLLTTARQIQANGLPTFIVGDFSVDFRTDPCATDWFPCQTLRRAGFKSAYELTRLAGMAYAQGTVGSSNQLTDYVFAPTDSRVETLTASVSSGGACKQQADTLDCYYGSSHRPSLAAVKITAKEGYASLSATNGLRGVRDFRDLSQVNPGLIKKGTVYRSGQLATASESDRSKLSALLNNGTIVDLRTNYQRASEPDPTISGTSRSPFPTASATGAQGYVTALVNDPAMRKQYGAALAKIAHTSGAVLIHDTQNTARTAWLVSMVLYAAGANDEQVLQEYLKSQDTGPDYQLEAAWLSAAITKARSTNNGSMIEFITSADNGLGVSQETLKKLAAKVGN